MDELRAALFEARAETALEKAKVLALERQVDALAVLRMPGQSGESTSDSPSGSQQMTKACVAPSPPPPPQQPPPPQPPPLSVATETVVTTESTPRALIEELHHARLEAVGGPGGQQLKALVGA